MKIKFSDAELESFLDESLNVGLMAQIEEALRSDSDLTDRLSVINGRRDAGVHSLGEIWRRRRLTCPTREQLGSFLLGVLPAELSGYVTFHLETIGCRYCEANLADLKAQQPTSDAAIETRRSRYFQSSAGYLKQGGNS